MTAELHPVAPFESTESYKRPILTTSGLPSWITDQIQIEDNGCWTWIGTTFTTGYGLISFEGRLFKAHRFIYTYLHGPIGRLHCCHHCDNPPCVNPAHLFVGTNRDNQRDKAAKGRHWQQKKTVCPQGHAYTPENTYWSKQGHRRCLICLNASRKAARHA